jgi:hypothetical protein
VGAYHPVTDFGLWLDMTRGGRTWDVFIRRQIRGYFKRAAGVASDREFDDYITNFSVVKRAAAITAPVLLISGQKDPTVSIDRALHAKMSGLIFRLLSEYFSEAAGRKITTGMISSLQTFGKYAGWHPHWLPIVLKGGFDRQPSPFTGKNPAGSSAGLAGC